MEVMGVSGLERPRARRIRRKTLANSKAEETLSHQRPTPLVTRLSLVYKHLSAAMNEISVPRPNVPTYAQRDAVHARFAVGRDTSQLATISRLPNELLAQIFFFVRGEMSSWVNWHCWINVINICRHWRKVGLADPTLWSRLDYKCPQLAELWRGRSGDTPLSLKLPKDGVSTALKQGVLLRELPRTWQLNVACASPAERIVINEALRAPAPLLVEFTVHGAGALPSDIFARDAPRLRVLFAMHSTIPWRSPGFTNLTNVALHNRGDYAHNWEDVFGFFSASPRMTNLALENYLGKVDGTSPTGTVLPMNYLSHVEIIEEDLEIIDMFLSVVKLRPDIYLLVAAKDMFYDDFFPEALSAHFRAATKYHVWREIHFTEGEWGDNTFTFRARPAARCNQRVPQLLLRGGNDVDTVSLIERVLYLVGEECLQHVEELAIHDTEDGVPWKAIFTCAPRLCKIDARWTTVSHELVMHLLGHTTPQTRTALSDLTLCRVDGNTAKLADGRCLEEHWIDLMTTWHRMKAPLIKLTLDSCLNFDVMRLQQVIDEVIVV